MHLCLFSHQWLHASWWNITQSRSLPQSLQCFHLTSLIPTVRLISVATRKHVPSNSNYECIMHLKGRCAMVNPSSSRCGSFLTSPYHISCLPFSSPKIQDKEAAMVLEVPSSPVIWEQARKERWYWSLCNFLRTSSVSEIPPPDEKICSFSLLACIVMGLRRSKLDRFWSPCQQFSPPASHSIYLVSLSFFKKIIRFRPDKTG